MKLPKHIYWCRICKEEVSIKDLASNPRAKGDNNCCHYTKERCLVDDKPCDAYKVMLVKAEE